MHQFHEYLRNTFSRLRKTTLKMISSFSTLTALIIKISWKIILSWLRWLRGHIVYSDYADYADIQLYVKNNFIINYTDYVVMKGYWKCEIGSSGTVSCRFCLYTFRFQKSIPTKLTHFYCPTSIHINPFHTNNKF